MAAVNVVTLHIQVFNTYLIFNSKIYIENMYNILYTYILRLDLHFFTKHYHTKSKRESV